MSSYVGMLKKMDQFSNQFQGASSQTGFDAQIKNAESLDNQINQTFSGARKGFKVVKIIKYLIFILTLLILFFIGFAARKNLPSIFRWIGWALFIPGMFIATLFLVFQSPAYLKFATKLISLSPDIHTLLDPLFINIFHTILLDIGKVALITGIIGVIAIIFSYILGHFLKAPVVESKKA